MFAGTKKLVRHEEAIKRGLLTTYETLPDLSKSGIIFVSHRWRHGKPDDREDNIKFKTITLGLNLIQRQVGRDVRLYVWIDYSCIAQDDHDKNGSGIRSLPAYVERSAMLLTPLLTDEMYSAEELERVKNLDGELLSLLTKNMAPEHRRLVGEHSHLLDVTSRAWLRMEQYVASNVPFCGKQIGQFDFFSAVGGHRTDRPHFIVSPRTYMVAPLPCLPPLSNEYVRRLDPIHGQLFQEDDRSKIRVILDKLEPYVEANEEESYTGEVDEEGNPHGRGKRISPNGDIYEGLFVHGKCHGYGTLWASNGTKYEGNWKDGQMHGTGTLWYSSGDRHVGNFQCDQRHGEGRYICGRDIVTYDGVWERSLSVKGEYVQVNGGKIMKTDQECGAYLAEEAGIKSQDYFFGIEGFKWFALTGAALDNRRSPSLEEQGSE